MGQRKDRDKTKFSVECGRQRWRSVCSLQCTGQGRFPPGGGGWEVVTQWCPQPLPMAGEWGGDQAVRRQTCLPCPRHPGRTRERKLGNERPACQQFGDAAKVQSDSHLHSVALAGRQTNGTGLSPEISPHVQGSPPKYTNNVCDSITFCK